LPLQFAEGESATSLALSGTETFNVEIPDTTQPQQIITVLAISIDSTITRFQTLSRLDTPIEVQYYRDGGILRTVLKKLI
jgi:aconitate hydratase A / 2-methylisocitrate dehydratase